MHGLLVYRASRLEALVPPLQALLEATRPDGVLTPQTVLAAHPGMKAWLVRELARQVGPARIVANLEITLPSAWLDELSRQLLGKHAIALPSYRRQHLRWTLHELLGESLVEGVNDQRVRDYLQSECSTDERARRRLQLADRLARVYSQYLVYRHDWLHAWEAGKWSWATTGHESLRALETGFLAPLWQATAARLGAHRGTLMRELADRLDAPDAVLPPLHVFGLSHLPPVEMALLRAYARHAPVFLYVPDPCREFWGGLYTPQQPQAWQHYKQAEATLLDANAGGEFWRDDDHPLLARWGRMGRHFFAALADGEVREDTRHWQDEQPAPATDRLSRLQNSIRERDATRLRESPSDPSARADASLRVHACHTRQRELEVLRDALLDAVARLGVKPGDMVVMAPDIHAYLPLIPAVFGEPGSTRESILPYHLADVPVSRRHPLFDAFATLIELGTRRVSAPEVVDLLAVEPIRRALRLDEDDVDTLVEWLRASHVAWGLDARHKQALGLPPRSEYSFSWAMDRLLAGYLMADGSGDATSVTLADGTGLLPVGHIDGPSAAALGALDFLLRELETWRRLARENLPASAWSECLRQRVDALFAIGSDDDAARSALSAIQRAIAAIAMEPAHNGTDPSLPLAVVRDLLKETLEATPEHQRFLMGGITFCGMVPQRAIPFEVVCVLGLDEGDFPRQRSDGGINLMARLRRLGDRDVSTDDRYLFLETLMSARRQLHLSYIGRNVRDNQPRNPAAPLAELLAELERQCGIHGDDAPRPWLVQHPLQPFDARYFAADAGDPALFSYSKRFAGMTTRGRKPTPRFRDGAMPVPPSLPERIALRTLSRFFKHPSEAILKDHLGLALDALDDDAQLADSEPLDAIASLHTVARRTFFEHALPARCGGSSRTWTNDEMPDWVAQGGVLPIGAAGLAAWQGEADAVNALLEVADASKCFDARAAQGAQAVAVDVALPSDNGKTSRIVGTVTGVFPLHNQDDGVQRVIACPKSSNAKKHLKSAADLHFGDLVPAFLDWALLRLQRRGTTPAPVRLTVLADGDTALATRVNVWDEAYCAADDDTRERLDHDLVARVAGLVGLWQRGCAGDLRYHPRTATALLRKIANCRDEGITGDAALRKAAHAIRGTWIATYKDAQGERDYAPGYARLLEGDLVFGDAESDPDMTALEQLLAAATAIDRLLDLTEGAP